MFWPNLNEERKLWKKGIKFVIGVDEVGRGAFAGPLVVGAVCITSDCLLPEGINDSKVLKKLERIRLAKKICSQCFTWSVAETSVAKINRLGISRATALAVRAAVKKILKKPKVQNSESYLLVDAFYIKYVRGLGLKRQRAIVKGDGKCLSIAAASILAKVYRDRLMKKMAKKFPEFGWGKNKGYGTVYHREAILKHGQTRMHRKRFVQTWLSSLL
jgi:ribonuclease HII